MSQNIGITTLTATQLHDVSADKTATLGTIATTRDGRVYRYAKAGATALAAGSTFDANGTTAKSITVTTPKVYDRKVATSTTLVAGAYEDGVFAMNNAQFLVDTNEKGVVSLVDGIDIAPSGTSASLLVNPFYAAGTTDTNHDYVVEVAVPANNYFWARVA